ncbi:SDR family NAD(P)-dependent oxidoreductase [Novosphingobium lentum]|uniref:SDR family NAD(P)-dependent oxidoreductase n=1 Tax=Novosphingobium lentum TaxID=145287 RepID=UPI000833BDA9|nr:SDR family NAD(P)-dependent oxidoreductase [Novosphingobium lentum]
MDLGIAGKRALVTGSTSGIGAATARMLAAEGVRVIVNGRNADRAEAVRAGIEAAGGTAAVALGDLATDDGADAVMRAALGAFGGIDILINNLGQYEPFAPVWTDATPAQWAATYEANVIAAVRTIRASVDGMKAAGWGRIINIASGAYTEPPPEFPTYGPSKAALVNLSVGLAKSLADTGITVNTVSPGNVLTEALKSNLPIIGQANGWEETGIDALERRFAKQWRSLVSRTGRVEEIAAVICFVASAHASYITGTNYRVDGGSHATLN